MQIARSASFAASVSRSAVETPTTHSMPSRFAARTMRTAISPRLATNNRAIFFRSGIRTRGIDQEQHLIKLDKVSVLRADPRDLAGGLGLHVVHELHHLADRDRAVGSDLLPERPERRR